MPAVRTAGGLSVQDVVRRTSPAIVLVRATTSQGEALGSGFLIDDQGHILTNDHVVDSAGQVQVTFSDRTTSTARVLGTDPSTDLAVLQVSDVPASAHPVALGRSGSLTVGDDVVALGNPLGLERTATTGIVSALKREITSPNGFPIQNVVQTDAAINHGNSGGPLLDLQGRVIGINSQIASESGGSDGIGFAVPIDTVRPVAESIIETGKAQHAWMGITGRDLDPQLAEKVGLPGQTGVLIDKADPRGPAARAGIEGASNPDAAVPRGGDLVVAIDGHAVTDMADVSQQVASRRVGDSVSVTVLRDGKRMNLEMTLADRPSDVGIR